jgi:hypothetical protein
MRFHFEQRFAAAVDDVARAFADPAFYETLGDLSKLGRPELLSAEADDDRATLRIRYRFTGNLSAAVRAAIDPARLTWVEESEHDLAAHTATFRMVADHYADRFEASGSYRFEPDGRAGARRVTDGEVRIRFPLVGGKVEGAIVSGIGEHLEAEVALIESYLASGSSSSG